MTGQKLVSSFEVNLTIVTSSGLGKVSRSREGPVMGWPRALNGCIVPLSFP